MKGTRLMKLAGAFLSTIVLTYLSTLGSPAQATELRIATQPAPHYAPIFVAKQKHWLEDDLAKDGVTVKWSSFVAGPPENESFAAGQQDVGFMGDTPAIIARSAGQNTRIIGIAAIGPKALAVVVPKGSPIKSPTDLRGKRVAVTKGSYAHHLLYVVLKNAGLQLSDIKLIHLPPADLVTALLHGDVDAAATWEPYLSRIEEAGGHVLVDGTGIKKGELVIIAIDEYAKKNPHVVEKFLRAYQRGYDFIKANPKRAGELIASDVKLTPEQFSKVLPKFDYVIAIGPEHVEELKKTEEFLRSHELTKNLVDIDAFVDARYLKAVERK
jgi:sulfonate transport system substrate-binding protein